MLRISQYTFLCVLRALRDAFSANAVYAHSTTRRQEEEEEEE